MIFLLKSRILSFPLDVMVLCLVYVAIDIGATWTRIALFDAGGKIIRRVKIKTLRVGTKEEFLGRIINAVDSLLKESEIKGMEAIGIGSIGPIDMRRGLILRSPNIDIANIPIILGLKRKYGVPVYMVNDCTAAVIAEKEYGQGKRYDNVVYITISSGIGGGAIVDGKVLFGKDGNAVEIGHFVVDMEGRLRCGCGGLGHWEAYTSGRNVHKYVELLLHEKYAGMSEGSPLLMLDEEITYEVLVSYAERDDVLARDLLMDIARTNAIGFANVVNAFDPDIIVVGGSVALKNPPELIMEPIRKHIVNFTINRIPRIVTTGLGDDVVLYGAFHIAKNPQVLPARFRM